jgi:hypothetical protein
VSEVKLRNDAIEWREVEGQIVVLDVDAAEYLAINPTGAAIWPLLAEGATREQLAERLVAGYGINESSAARDVEEFVTGLAERGLLEKS